MSPYYNYWSRWPAKPKKKAIQKTANRQKFGLTWWGGEWLKSLSHIDFDNRLPRGKTYANNGSVTKLEISGSLISAKVEGSRPTPYTVKIKVPEITADKKSLLSKKINEKPYFLAQLLSRELPPELNKLAQECGIKLFPASWKDLEMSCSCPDWAVPCKHIAAVIFLVAAEIDKNPFVLLNMKDFHLENLSTQDSNAGILEVPLFKTLFQKPSKQDSPVEIASLQRPDLSLIPESNTQLLDLLKASPLFYHKDFKIMLEKAYGALPKFAASIRDKDWLVQRHPWNNQAIRLIIDPKDHFVKAVGIQWQGRSGESNLAELMKLLLATEAKSMEICHPQWQWLHALLLFCFRLLETGAFYPSIWKNAEDTFFIRWVPAGQIAEVAAAMKMLTDSMPPEVLFVRDFTTTNSKVKPLQLARKEIFVQVCHSFLQLSIFSAFTLQKFPKDWYDNDLPQEIVQLFGKCATLEFKGFGKKEIPASIYQWLAVFSIPDRKYKTLLQVNESLAGFTLQCFFKKNADTLSPMIPLKGIFEKSFADSDRMKILKDLRIVASHIPMLDSLMQSHGENAPRLSMDELNDLLRVMAPRMAMMGVGLLFPKSLSQLIRPKVKLNLHVPGSAKANSFFNLADILSYQWKISLGELEIDAAEFMHEAANAKGLVKIRDQYILINDKELQQLQKDLLSKGKPGGLQLLQAAISGYIPDGEVGLDPSVVKHLNALLKAKPVAVPASLKANLRPYQVRGFQWLVHNAGLGMGSILADDMGLGKTVQVLSWLLYCRDAGHLNDKKALIVMPTSLLSNWQKEISRFSPDLRTQIYYGVQRQDDFSEAEVILTSYGALRNDDGKLAKFTLYALIIDEAQNIKNHVSEQSKAVKKFKANVRIALSGTPVENRLSEYWSIFDFANHGYMGNNKYFNEHFARPIQVNNDQQRIGVFRKLTAPFIMRRLKTDKTIIADLPDKLESNQFTSLTPAQAALYQSIVDTALEKIESSEGIQRKALILTMMMALKQIGNHPVQYLKVGQVNTEDSGKLQLLLQIVSDIMETNEKVLIFTQFKEMGSLLKTCLEAKFEEDVLFLHGGCSRPQRDTMVNQFQENPGNRIFILSLKAGGTGLNLTAANHVIHYDLWWNPAVETQASDRAYRIGQKKNVLVYRLINQGTIEEKIDAMVQQKKSLANLTVATGETWLGNLSNSEIKALVHLAL